MLLRNAPPSRRYAHPLELTGEVPERYLDAAYGREDGSRLAAGEDIKAAQLLVESFDVPRVLADELVLQVHDDLVDGGGRGRGVALTESVLVRDADEHRRAYCPDRCRL